ncbi:hypothetical protein [Sediminicoccus sp. KRV36]|uniref:hypothetical protein n=1 Tax=Sediminicoccus sp. KRV36 TaxID=3133721 RepID=UPI0020101E46|nr:hypothetical protein [Sediminicoccus rosea]UPY38587.1 hypothetical protein LHU95_07790 [Sediminicoccus rosea]
MFRLALLALPLLAACASTPPVDTARLPRDATIGAGDPARGAVFSTNSVFSERHPAAGRPADAARAIAQMEFLAVDLPQNNNLTAASSTLVPDLATARREWRGVLDIAPDAPAQPVINALFAASRALDAGQPDAAASALPSTLFRKGGTATLTQLAALPRMPSTASAAATAQQSLQAVTGGRLAL